MFPLLLLLETDKPKIVCKLSACISNVVHLFKEPIIVVLLSYGFVMMVPWCSNNSKYEYESVSQRGAFGTFSCFFKHIENMHQTFCRKCQQLGERLKYFIQKKVDMF